MTGTIDKLYEETDNGRLLEIARLTQPAPGVVTASSIAARVDGDALPNQFDYRTNEPFRASGALGGLPRFEYASALAARAYCDDEAAALAQRGDEPLSLPFTGRERQPCCTFCAPATVRPAEQCARCMLAWTLYGQHQRWPKRHTRPLDSRVSSRNYGVGLVLSDAKHNPGLCAQAQRLPDQTCVDFAEYCFGI